MWFDIVDGTELQQGDLIPEFPFIRPLLNQPAAVGTEFDVETVIFDAIVLSQTCDLVEGRVKLNDVVLCTAPTLENAQSAEGHALAKSDNRKLLIKYGLIGFHPLKEFASPAIARSMTVVEFSGVLSAPVKYVREAARASGKRLRLRSPYREHLAQRFGYFFSRVALTEELKLPEASQKPSP